MSVNTVFSVFQTYLGPEISLVLNTPHFSEKFHPLVYVFGRSSFGSNSVIIFIQTVPGKLQALFGHKFSAMLLYSAVALAELESGDDP